jgi:hypothetical protein
MRYFKMATALSTEDNCSRINSSILCKKCKKKTTNGVTCHKCSLRYHYKCAVPEISTLDDKTNENRQWVCADCLLSNQDGGLHKYKAITDITVLHELLINKDYLLDEKEKRLVNLEEINSFLKTRLGEANNTSSNGNRSSLLSPKVRKLVEVFDSPNKQKISDIKKDESSGMTVETDEENNSVFNIKTAEVTDKCSEGENRKIRVVVVTDSHGKGLEPILTSKLGCDYEVKVIFKSGVKLNEVVEKARKEAENLQGRDWLVVMGGSNDLNTPQNEIAASITRLTPVSRKCKLIINNIVRRQRRGADTEDPNTIIKQCNNLIHKTVNAVKDKCVSNVRINFLDKKLADEHLGKDGLHLNTQGKHTLCSSIAHFLPLTKLTKPTWASTGLEKWLQRDTNKPKEDIAVKTSEHREQAMGSTLDRWVLVTKKTKPSKSPRDK